MPIQYGSSKNTDSCALILCMLFPPYFCGFACKERTTKGGRLLIACKVVSNLRAVSGLPTGAVFLSLQYHFMASVLIRQGETDS
jgi:hypothetical protein